MMCEREERKTQGSQVEGNTPAAINFAYIIIFNDDIETKFQVDMTIDSGSSVNIIDENLWKELKNKGFDKSKAQALKQHWSLKVNSKQNLISIDTVESKLNLRGNFCPKGHGPALLGKETAFKLGVFMFQYHK